MIKSLLFCIGWSLIWMGCSKEIPMNEINLVKLNSYRIVEGTERDIDESSIEVSNKVILSNEEILTFESSEQTFVVSKQAAERFQETRESTGHFKDAFALMVGNKMVFTGYIWSNYSSELVNWQTISPTGDRFYLRLKDHPTEYEHYQLFLEVRETQGKLIR